MSFFSFKKIHILLSIITNFCNVIQNIHNYIAAVIVQSIAYGMQKNSFTVCFHEILNFCFRNDVKGDAILNQRLMNMTSVIVVFHWCLIYWNASSRAFTECEWTYRIWNTPLHIIGFMNCIRFFIEILCY